MGMGFAPTWLRQVSPPASQNQPLVSHAIVFAQMRHAVCRRQLSFLFPDSVDCITRIIAEYAVKTPNFPYTWRWRWYRPNGETRVCNSIPVFLFPRFRTELESLIPESLAVIPFPAGSGPRLEIPQSRIPGLRKGDRDCNPYMPVTSQHYIHSPDGTTMLPTIANHVNVATLRSCGRWQRYLTACFEVKRMQVSIIFVID